MKNSMLLIASFVWLHNAVAQYEAGIEQYCTLDNKAVAVMPVYWYENDNGWGGEVRYNYEEHGAFSVYVGKTVSGKRKPGYSVSVMAGAVLGSFRGGSFLINGDMLHKKLAASVQSQYTFSMQDHSRSFFYSWSDVSLRISPAFSAGVSLQQTQQYKQAMVWQPGIFARTHIGSWVFPVYIFNPAKNNAFFMMGFTYSWQKHKALKLPLMANK